MRGAGVKGRRSPVVCGLALGKRVEARATVKGESVEVCCGKESMSEVRAQR